jgi:mannosyltransferase OCH1-like enzyme
MIETNNSIPKIIMQTWKTKDIPLKWKESPESITKFMPDWKHVLMTDEDNLNFVKNYFPDFLSYYVNYPYNIQRADAIRYMWLYVNGGIYMDLDISLKKNLEDLFENKDNNLYLVKSNNIQSSVTNSLMISNARNPFWLKVIEKMKENSNLWYFGKHFTVMCTTGPIMLQNVIKSYQNRDYVILDGKKLNGCNVCNIDNYKEKDTDFVRSLKGSSWVSTDTRVYNFVLCNKNQLIYFLYLFIIFTLTFLLVYFIWKKLK